MPGLRKGDAVRLMTGGVAVLDGGLLGRLIEGLSHDEKKSSPGSPVGVAVPSVLEGAMMSVITTSFGYLSRYQRQLRDNAKLLQCLLLYIHGSSPL